MQSFFILGRIKELSIQELQKFAEIRIGRDFELKIDSKFAILETDKKIDYQIWQKELGGIIKCGEVLKEVKKISLEEIKKIILDFKKEKIFFGLSFYAEDDFPPIKIREYSVSLKKLFKQENLSASFLLTKDKPYLQTFTLLKNKLLEKGVELVFLMRKEKILIGRTKALQSVKEEAEFDFSRPAHEIKEGLIPPKLAKIMINLAQAKKEDKILDPFCGSGTILGQALLMGYQDLTGADLGKKAISGAKKNLAWLKTKFEKESQTKIFLSDVREIWRKIPPASFGAIVTEPYLGPIRKLNEQKIKEEILNLSSLYLQAFASFKRILKPGGRVVIIFPVFKIYPIKSSRSEVSTEGGQFNRVKEKEYYLPILEEILKIGFQQEKIKESARGSLVYSRPGQRVLREIFVFKKKGQVHFSSR